MSNIYFDRATLLTKIGPALTVAEQWRPKYAELMQRCHRLRDDLDTCMAEITHKSLTGLIDRLLTLIKEPNPSKEYLYRLCFRMRNLQIFLQGRVDERVNKNTDHN